MHKKICNILITGGAGFIGSEFVRQTHKDKNIRLIVVDKLTYAGDLARLGGTKNKIEFHRIDISDKLKLEKVFKVKRPQTVINFAAETHVDRSILDVHPFIQTNIKGTQNLIDLCRKYEVAKMLHISTDEIYGDSRSGRFKEESPFKANNPYAATKSAAEHLVRASMRTHQLPAIIIRPSNNYGHWQYPEKLIPVVIFKALNNERVPVYGQGLQVREWLHVSDCARAVGVILKKGEIGQTYNIGSYFEQTNIKTVKMILKHLDKPEGLIEFVEDRPGHDFRYSVDCSKLRKLGWRPQVDFKEGLSDTVLWYKHNLPWLKEKHRALKLFWKSLYRLSK